MKNVLVAAALASTVLAGSTFSASAATIGFPRGQGNVTSFPMGNFTYDFDFMLSTPQSIDGISASSSSSVKNSKGKPIANLTFASVELFNSTGGTVYSSLAAGDTISGQSFNVYPGVNVAAGDYRVEIKGNVTAGTGSFNGNLSVSQVPLPSSVAMFGTALLGLAAVGGIGAMRRKSSSATA